MVSVKCVKNRYDERQDRYVGLPKGPLCRIQIKELPPKWNFPKQ